MTFTACRRNQFVAFLLAFYMRLNGAEAGDFSYAQWREMPDAWQRGYAASVVGRLSIVENALDPHGKERIEAFSRCLNGYTDVQAVETIKAYALQHPEALRLSVWGISIRAFNDLCKEQLPPPPH